MGCKSSKGELAVETREQRQAREAKEASKEEPSSQVLEEQASPSDNAYLQASITASPC